MCKTYDLYGFYSNINSIGYYIRCALLMSSTRSAVCLDGGAHSLSARVARRSFIHKTSSITFHSTAYFKCKQAAKRVQHFIYVMFLFLLLPVVCRLFSGLAFGGLSRAQPTQPWRVAHCSPALFHMAIKHRSHRLSVFTRRRGMAILYIIVTNLHTTGTVSVFTTIDCVWSAGHWMGVKICVEHIGILLLIWWWRCKCQNGV